MIRLADEAIKANAEVITFHNSIHPKGVDERRDIALAIFQKRQSENKVEDLASLLQAAPDLLKACQEALRYVDVEESAHDLMTKAIRKALPKKNQPR